MTDTAALLTLLTDTSLRDDVERAAAAAGVVRAAHLDPSRPPLRAVWSAAAAVVLDREAATGCTCAGLPRRPAVFVCGLTEPDAATLQVAISIGAQSVLLLPEQTEVLVRAIADARLPAAHPDSGVTVAVIPGRGGAGASVFAAALAHCFPRALLVDLDPWSGGADLLLGAEHTTGLRWPELAVQSGRLSWPAVHAALPSIGDITVLSGARRSHDVPAGAVAAVLGAGRRDGVTAVCDLPRIISDPVATALDDADLVVVVTTCDVRACAATVAMAPAISAVNPNVGLVVRGPAPGGLRAAEIAELTGLPLLADMRPEPLIAEKLEHGGLRLRARSPLAAAAGRVAALLPNRGVGKAA